MERTARRFTRILRTNAFLAVPLALVATLSGCSTGEVSPAVTDGAGDPSETDPTADAAEATPVEATDQTPEQALETITLGAGCY